MAKRANQKRKIGKRQRTAERTAASAKRTTSSTKRATESTECATASAECTTDLLNELQCDLVVNELEFEPLDDPFFYESPFPPEVVLDAIEPPPAVYTPAMIARRRKLRTFVAMVVGVAATLMLVGLGKTMMMNEGVAQERSMTVPVSP